MAAPGCGLLEALRKCPEFFRELPDDILESEYDILESEWEREVPPVLLPRWTILDSCAASGCQLCIILLPGTERRSRHLSKPLTPTTDECRLVRQPNDYLTLFCGLQKLSWKQFYRVPQEWQSVPPARLKQPAPEIDFIRNWADICCRSHDMCRKSVRREDYPRMLLDVGVTAFASSKTELADIRLIYSKDVLEPVKWVALSHCWGPPSLRPILTTKDTLSERCRRIPFSSLSLTFQDATRLTRQLGYRYLWIDSLCIIQDEISDWENEAKRMAMIYEGAELTLCALSSENSNQGCRTNGTGLVSSPRDSHADSGDFDIAPGIRIRLFNKGWPRNWDDESGHVTEPYQVAVQRKRNPLKSRAWALQERQLSRRKVLFSQGMLLWECETIKGSEEMPWKKYGLNARPASQPLPILLDAQENFDWDGPAQIRDRWYLLIDDYTSRLLTKESDKLVAMAGLEERFRTLLGPSANCMAGLWDVHMPACLLWQIFTTDVPVRRPTGFSAPSWSWASLGSAVSYRNQRTKPQSKYVIKHSATFLSASYQPGRKTGGLGIKLRAAIGSVRFLPLPPPEAYNNLEWRKDMYTLISDELDDRQPILGALFPDVKTELEGLNRVFCIAIQDDPSQAHDCYRHWMPSSGRPGAIGSMGDPELVMGLAVLEVKPGTYRRVGMVRWVVPCVFEGAEPQDIVLV
ncbi:heterokaryon incompatibility protein-domain-containing protein [Cladorrhinum sp. PSN332]|nr:heterokaryon incompatibility protein-domain-containing protein [Cladorrhinum sp. PSN332]